jgi:cell division protein FtsB
MERARRSRWIAEGVSLVLLALCLVLLLTGILPVRRRTARLEREAARLEEEIRRHETERARLDKLAEALETDPFVQEREYKRTFRIYRPGEKVLRFPEAETE